MCPGRETASQREQALGVLRESFPKLRAAYLLEGAKRASQVCLPSIERESCLVIGRKIGLEQKAVKRNDARVFATAARREHACVHGNRASCMHRTPQTFARIGIPMEYHLVVRQAARALQHVERSIGRAHRVNGKQPSTRLSAGGGDPLEGRKLHFARGCTSFSEVKPDFPDKPRFGDGGTHPFDVLGAATAVVNPPGMKPHAHAHILAIGQQPTRPLEPIGRYRGREKPQATKPRPAGKFRRVVQEIQVAMHIV